jgi:hypothetical protein
MATYILIYVLIAALWLLYFVWFKEYMGDCTRQKLFEVRDELFDYAADGNISFDDEAYLTARTTINGVIRFAHNASLTQLIMMLLCRDKHHEKYEREFSAQFSKAIEKLNVSQAKAIHSAIFKTHTLLFNHFVNTSPLLFVMVKPLLILIDVITAIRIIKDKFLDGFSLWSPIDAQANFIGHSVAI